MADVGLPKFNRECYNCGFILRISYNFCPECGTEVEENNEHPDYDERAIITEYFKTGFEYSTIVEMLEKEQSVKMSVRTLKSRLNDYGLKRRNVVYDEVVVRQRIDELLNGPGCIGWLSLYLAHTPTGRGTSSQGCG